jgi:hypothetical protein
LPIFLLVKLVNIYPIMLRYMIILLNNKLEMLIKTVPTKM